MPRMNVPVIEKDLSLDTISPAPTPKTSSRSLFFYFILALGFALIIRFFVAAPYLVDGASMDPTFHDGNYLVVDRITYTLENPSRGDVIVFGLPGTPSKSLIKRVIGLPNEKVIITPEGITIENAANPDGFLLDEPYLDPTNLGGRNDMQITLGADEYFVMGDNRHVSSDSRIWGPLPRENIVGRAFLRLFPFDRIGVLPGEAKFEE